MTTPVFPTVWYWVISDTTPLTTVWEGSTGQSVSNSSATYQSWVANGGKSSIGQPQPKVTGAADNGSGAVRLTVDNTAGMFTNDVWVVQNVVMSGATVVNGTWAITFVDTTHIDLQGSSFSPGDSLTTAGVIDRGTLIDTFANFCISPLDSYNQSLTQPKFTSVNLPGGTVSLALPLPLIVDINCTAPGTLVLPQMNLFGSPGLDRLLIINNIGSAAFVLQDFGNTTLVSSVAAADLVLYWNESNTSKAGTIRGQVLKNINTVARGGTGVGIFTAHAILQSSSALGAVDSADLAAATAGNIPIDQGAGSAWLSKAISGDISLSSAGVTALQNIPNDTPMAGDLLATAIAAPGTPAAGKVRIYADSTSKNHASKDDGGNINHGVRTKAAVTHNFMTAIADDGSSTLAQPATGDLSDISTFNLATSGTIDTSNTTNATSTTTGALQSAGGLGIAKDAYIGGDIFLATATKFFAFGPNVNAPTIGGSYNKTVAANASLGISANTMVVILYRDETVGGAALVAIEPGTTPTIIWQSASNFVTADPGAGASKWFLQNAASHFGDALNRYAVSHGLSYMMLCSQQGTFV